MKRIIVIASILVLTLVTSVSVVYAGSFDRQFQTGVARELGRAVVRGGLDFVGGIFGYRGYNRCGYGGQYYNRYTTNSNYIPTYEEARDARLAELEEQSAYQNAVNQARQGSADAERMFYERKEVSLSAE